MPFTAPDPADVNPVRAKFYVDTFTVRQWGSEVILRPVTRGADNKEWAEATPNGELRLTIKSSAADNFAPGQEWYIDLRPVPADQVGQEG